MIEINLSSQDLKAGTKEKRAFAGLDIKYLIYAFPAAFALLIFIHLFLALLALVGSSQLSTLERKWKALEPQRKTLGEFKQQYAAYSQDANLIKQLTQQRISWSEKLNRLSLDLPSGIWLYDVSANPREFTLRGSVVSPEKLEMALIKKLIDNLKSDNMFFKDFTAIELGPLQSKMVAGYDITDFNLKGILKTK
jgi:hypothetical protein